MKARIINIFFFLAMAFITLPAFCQNYLEVRTNDGNYSRFFVDSISSIFISNYDENGIRQSDYGYQHIMTSTQDYVLALSEIEYISFTKYDEETALNNFCSAMMAIFPIINECETIEDVENCFTEINSVNEVEEAWIVDSYLWVKVENSITCCISFDNNMLEDDEYLPIAGSSSRRNAPEDDKDGDNKIDCCKQNILFLDDPRWSPEPNYKEKRDDLIKDLNKRGINAVRKELTWDYLVSGEICKYNVIYLGTQTVKRSDTTDLLPLSDLLGSIKKGTKEEIEDLYRQFLKKHGSSTEDIRMYLCLERRGNQYTGRILVNDSFIRDKVCSFVCPNTKIFGPLLSGNMWSTIKSALKMKGATVLPFQNNKTSPNLIEDGLRGKSFERSSNINSKKEKIKSSEDQNNTSPENQDEPTFLTGIYSDTSPSTAIIEYSQNGTVTLAGRGFLLDPVSDSQSPQSLGFQLSTDENMDNSTYIQAEKLESDDRESTNFRFSSTISGLKEFETYYYRPYFFDGEYYNFGEIQAITPGSPCPDNHHPHMIDMGNGVRWSCCNVGASTPWDYGGFYAWGETEEKDHYSRQTYQPADDIGEDIAGTEYDVARKKMGAFWEMPSEDDFIGLIEKSSYEPYTLREINGFLFISAINGNVIFMPAAGSKWYADHDYQGTNGYYYSSTWDPENSNNAIGFYFYNVNESTSSGAKARFGKSRFAKEEDNDSGIGTSSNQKKYGHTVRPKVDDGNSPPPPPPPCP